MARLAGFFQVDRLAIPEAKKRNSHQVAAQLEKEAQKLKAVIPPGSHLVVLDEGGQEFSSEELARELERYMTGSVREVTFLVGGYAGIPESIKGVAQRVIALSRMTLPHELARVVLLEQLYRAMTIVKGLPYHK